MKKIVIILTILTSLIIQSCNKQELPSDNIKISESHLEDIHTAVKLYKNSFLEVLDNKKATNLSSLDKSEQISSLFQKKIEGTFGSPTVLKSSSTTGNTINTDVLQEYMDEMADRLLEIGRNTTSSSKDEVIRLMSEQRDLYIDEIKNDKKLADCEKTTILENVMLSSEMIFVTLRYGDKLEEIQLKKGESWGWYKKNKKKIECTIKSAAAVAVCATAAAASGEGVWILWLKCAVATATAVDCWAQL